MKTKRTAGKTSSIPASLAIGAGVGILIILIAAAMSAFAVAQEWISEDEITIVSIVITVLAAAVAAITSANVAGKRKLQISLLSGVILIVILLASNAMFFDGQYSGVVRSAIAVLATCAVAAILAIQEGRKGKKHTGKRAYR